MSATTNAAAQAGNAFSLNNLSSHGGGVKLWSLVFDLPGERVNKLNRPVMREFDELIGRLEKMAREGEVDAVVLFSGKPGNFIAGADIEMFTEVKTAEEATALSQMGQKLLNRWEDLPFPTVAAVEGACLGGGCEVSLASTAIVMSDDPAARIGLPEVNLGIVPGTGGCIRLPRKVGLAGALDLILTGKMLNGDRAFKAGLIDGFLPRQNFQESTLRWVKTNLSALRSGKRLAREPKLGGAGGPVGAMMEKTPIGRMVIFSQARKGVLSKTKGHYPAPFEAIRVIQGSGTGYGIRLEGKARDEALAIEARAFGRLAVTDVSRNLVRLFFLTEAVKRSKGVERGSEARARPVRSGAVLGAGVMGGGIAQLFAEKSIPARMKDINTQALTLGVQSAASIFRKQVQRKRINRRQFLQRLNCISPTLDFSGFQGTDVVVEAVVENMDIKKKVLQELEGHVRDSCIIASNTSSLSISEMQTALRNPGRFVGMHFFNPVHRMPLVEVIRGERTTDEAVTTVFQFSKQLGKTPIVVKDAPGFLVNRLLMPYCNEAAWLLHDGVPIDRIDEVMLAFGMPMGPIELIDEVGIDVGAKVAHILHDAFGARMEASPLNDRMVKSGHLGKKNGKGFYHYDAKKKKGEVEPGIYEILEVKPTEGRCPEEEIVERCLLPMINEASRCLDERIVGTSEEVDLGMIMGTGFPPFRGGPLRYADTIGPRTLVDRLKHFQAKYGARFEPAPALVARAENGRKFYED